MRQGGQYVDSGGNAYEMQQQQIINRSGQRIDHKPPNNYRGQGQGQGRADHLNSVSESENFSYGRPLKGEGQWRWERDGSSSHMFNQGQGADASRSYYQSQGQGQRSDHRLNASEKQGSDLRCQPHEEDMEIGYEDNFAGHTFEALEQRFYDDIFKLTKQQNDAEDAENARHRERVNTISAQYEEQLAALRARHANRRDEILRRESHARQQQYANSGMGIVGSTHDHHGYNVDSYSCRDKPRFTRDSGGRGYGSASHYY